MTWVRLSSFLLVGLLAAGAARARADAVDSSLGAVDLRSEGSADATGIDVPHPRISWRLESPLVRGARESAYEVVVRDFSDAAVKNPEILWDSGKVPADNVLTAVYAGKPLTSFQRVRYTVRVWDEADRSSLSASNAWLMGIVDKADWQARWIAAPGASESLLLRKEFTVRPHPIGATLVVSGLGQYELRLNGSPALQPFLSPGWTRYDKTILYDTFEVGVHEGRNAVGLLLGNGLYNVVRRDRFVKFKGSFGPLRAILQLRIRYADGSVDTVVTDPTWRVAPGPITTGNLYSGEDWDARLEPAHWTEAGFDDRLWRHAVPLVQADEALMGHSAAADPIGLSNPQAPRAEVAFADGSRVLDFGDNASHIVRLRVTGPAGSTVRLTPAEVVNPDGRINRSTMDGKGRGDAWWQYTKATDAEEEWTSRFYYAGFRYLKAESFAPDEELPSRGPDADSGAAPQPAVASPPHPGRPTLTSILAIDVSSRAGAGAAGDFKASDPMLGRIRQIVLRAQRSNMMSVLTDCPHREKLGWIEEDHLNGPSIRYENDADRLFAKAVRDMAEAQEPSGMVPNIAPEYVRFEGPFRSAAEWGAAFVLVPWQQYQFTGDDTLIRTYYPQIRRYVDYLGSRTSDDILSDGLGDWFDLGPNPPQGAQLTQAPLTATAFYHEDLETLSEMASIVGDSEAAYLYAAKAARVADRFNRHFYDEARGTYGTGSQCANAMAIALGLATGPRHDRALAALVADLEAHHGMMTTGDVGFRFLLIALAENGRSDLVYQMVTDSSHPGYAFEVNKGETSLTESWDANLGTSHDHFMLGQVEEWYFRYLAGIAWDPQEPGFRHILIAPRLIRALSKVAATYPSVRGAISVAWQREDTALRLAVTIPAGSTARILVPADAGSRVTLDGREIVQGPNVKPLGRLGAAEGFDVSSGCYAFLSQCTPEH